MEHMAPKGSILMTNSDFQVVLLIKSFWPESSNRMLTPHLMEYLDLALGPQDLDNPLFKLSLILKLMLFGHSRLLLTLQMQLTDW